MVIGITGGTGTGKTTLLNEFEKRGALVIDCDALYHDLLKSDEKMRNEMTERFGPVFSDGELDRKALGRTVFSDDQALKDLNRITHKYVRRSVKKLLSAWKADGGDLAAVDAVALYESGISKLCDKTIAVTAPVESRAARIVEREGITPEYAMMRINSQKPDRYYERRCDYLLRNDCETLDTFVVKCNLLINILIGEIYNG